MLDHDTTERSSETLRAWEAAERAGDTTALRSLLTDDFAGIGPHGFQLDKQQWLDRYDSGDLVNDAFEVEDVATRPYGTDVVIVNGVQDQTPVYRGQAFPGRFRFTAVLVRRDEGWAIANVQLSRLSGQ